MSDLKPCPFCGCECIKMHHHFHPECSNCGAVQTRVIGEYAFKKWNTRSDGWISCDERLPEVGQTVDVYLKKKRFAGRRLTNMRWMKSMEQFRSEITRQHYNLDSVSHWMPLPQPPDPK